MISKGIAALSHAQDPAEEECNSNVLRCRPAALEAIFDSLCVEEFLRRAVTEGNGF
jgi:hypothetical protein